MKSNKEQRVTQHSQPLHVTCYSKANLITHLEIRFTYGLVRPVQFVAAFLVHQRLSSLVHHRRHPVHHLVQLWRSSVPRKWSPVCPVHRLHHLLAPLVEQFAVSLPLIPSAFQRRARKQVYN